MENIRAYFLKHRTGTIIVLVIVFILAGIFIWMRVNPGSKDHILTEAEIQKLLQEGSATGPGPLTEAEKKSLVESGSAKKGSSTESSLSDEQKQKLINSGSAK